LQAIAVLAGSLSSVNRIDLLPYHALGAHKWELLGLDYELADIDPPSPEQMKSLRQLVAAASHKPSIKRKPFARRLKAAATILSS